MVQQKSDNMAKLHHESATSTATANMHPDKIPSITYEELSELIDPLVNRYRVSSKIQKTNKELPPLQEQTPYKMSRLLIKPE